MNFKSNTEPTAIAIGSLLIASGLIGLAYYVNNPLSSADLQERDLNTCAKTYISQSLKINSPVTRKDLRNFRQVCEQQEAIK